MKERQIHITDADMERLRKLLDRMQVSNKDRAYLDDLEDELDRAVLVPADKVPPHTVTMNTRIRVKDLDSGKDMTIQLVFPSEADFEKGKISITAPIGTALIGYGVGDVVEWKVPAGIRRLKIEEILYQPESQGHAR
ncbi:MAG: nucleoside diphosphate kinase regulator [Acidobacteria bacterium]|nr:nucleoside diphosphate kinase regulator [Acidobacteriota bacterium]